VPSRLYNPVPFYRPAALSNLHAAPGQWSINLSLFSVNKWQTINDAVINVSNVNIDCRVVSAAEEKCSQNFFSLFEVGEIFFQFDASPQFYEMSVRTRFRAGCEEPRVHFENTIVYAAAATALKFLHRIHAACEREMHSQNAWSGKIFSTVRPAKSIVNLRSRIMR